MVGGAMGILLQVLALGPVVGRLAGARIRLLTAKADADDLDRVLQWVESGEIEITIDRRFRLEDTAEAVRAVGAGQTLGKVLVSPGDRTAK